MMKLVKDAMHLASAENHFGHNAIMLKHLFILFIILYAYLLMAGCDTKHASILSDNARILAFGDSLTYGTGAQKGEDYPSVLASLTGLEIINAGIPGEVSSDGLKRLPNLLDEHQPDLLILVHGGNDILKNSPEANLRKTY